jgi:hypothetical protein
MNDAKYIGVDVQQATICIAVLDSAGKLVMEAIIETKAETILQCMHGLRGSLQKTFTKASGDLTPAPSSCLWTASEGSLSPISGGKFEAEHADQRFDAAGMPGNDDSNWLWKTRMRHRQSTLRGSHLLCI